MFVSLKKNNHYDYKNPDKNHIESKLVDIIDLSSVVPNHRWYLLILSNRMNLKHTATTFNLFHLGNIVAILIRFGVFFFYSLSLQAHLKKSIEIKSHTRLSNISTHFLFCNEKREKNCHFIGSTTTHWINCVFIECRF